MYLLDSCRALRLQSERMRNAAVAVIMLSAPLCRVTIADSCQSENLSTPRAVLDCTVLLNNRGDANSACKKFLAAYQQFVVGGTISNIPLDDIERFLFEGGDCLLSYAQHAVDANARISDAAVAEKFFTAYWEWFSGLDDAHAKQLSNGGRIRSVVRYLGNALVTEDRKSEIPDFYLYSIGEPRFFGPDAIRLWEQTLRELYGVPGKSDSEDAKAEWSEYAKFLIKWATTPGMLKDDQREHYVDHGKNILQPSS